MRRFPISWDKTLSALGFRRNVKRIKRDYYRRKNSHIESLEQRAMLAADPLDLIQLEAEQFDVQVAGPTDQWVVETDKFAFSGSGYINSTNDDGSGYQPINPSTTNSPRLDYQFDASEAGDYYVWVRGWKTGGGNDSLHIGLDGQALSTSDKIQLGGNAGKWEWSNGTMDGHAATVNVASAGTHTLNLWMREDGARVDRIFLTKDANYTPAGFGSDIVVDTLADQSDNNLLDGISLREAIEIAGDSPGYDTIKFDESLFAGGAQTITLGDEDGNGLVEGTEASSQLYIDSSLSIEGPGSGLLTISGDEATRVINTHTNQRRDISLSGLTIADGRTGGYGAGIHNSGNHLTLDDVTFRNNASMHDSDGDGIYDAKFDGGALFFSGQNGNSTQALTQLTITGSTFEENYASKGGALRLLNMSFANAVIDTTTFANNYAFNQLTFAADGTPDLIFSTSAAKAYGGAIALHSSSLHGSGNKGSLTIRNSTFAGNEAMREGGAFQGGGGNTEVRIENSTFSGNKSYRGGAFRIPSQSIEIVNSTITDNKATFSSSSGGIDNYGADLTLHNTIVAGNLSSTDTPYDIRGEVNVASSHNLIGKRTNATTTLDSTNTVDENLDPGLLPLGDYGGPTLTHALGENSDAIDGGDSTKATHAGLTTDQRGLQRIAGNAIDIGAYETTHTIVVDTTSDAVALSDGVTSLREAIELAEQAPGENIITFDESLFIGGAQTILLGDEDGNGSVEGTEASSQLYIDSSLSIVGPGSDQLTISGNDQTRLFEISAIGVASISGVTLRDGKASSGGGIHNKGDLTLKKVAVTSNEATTGAGGGIYTGSNASLTIRNSDITNNHVLGLDGDFIEHFGGGVAIAGGDVNVERTTIEGNSSEYFGGGIASHLYETTNSFSLRSSSVSGNQSQFASGVSVINVDNPSIHNATISGNVASGGYGAGVYLSGSDVEIINSTITANRAGGVLPGSAGLHVNAPNPAYSLNTILHNTLIAGNTHLDDGQPSDIFGSVDTTNSTNNLIGNPNTAGGLSHGINDNIVGKDDALGGRELLPIDEVLDAELRNNGGPTRTHALVQNSPAIDAGDNSAIDSQSIDQRGLQRIANGIVDIGAIEFESSIVVDTTLDVVDSSDGVTSLREAIELAQLDPGENTITFDTTLFSTPQTIRVNQPLTIDDEEDEVSIIGPGADLLSISGGGISGTLFGTDSVFVIETDTSANLFGLTVTGGRDQGIENDGILQLDQVEVSENVGIGINSGDEGVLTIDRSTFAFNDGGGIRLAGTETFISNTTISGNEGFGGIEAISGAAVEITNATITNNDGDDSPFGGGINAQTSSEFTIYNSIIVGNTNDQGYSDIAPDAGIPLWQADFSGSNNLIGEAHDAVLTDGINPVDLELQPLGYYGGSTRTIALGENSPAIDAGDNSAIDSQSIDQRGLQRIANGIVDIGAIEFESSIVVDTTLDVVDSSDGVTSLREAIELAQLDPGENTITFDTTLFSTPQTIRVNQPLTIDDEEDEVSIIGPGADLLSISGGGISGTLFGTDSVFVIETDTSANLFGLTVTGGRDQGIENDGILQLDQVEVSENVGIGINSGDEGVLTIDRSTFAFNDGGGIRLAGTETFISNTTISGNEGFGGIEAISGAAVEITNATITNNDGDDSPFGGGINAQTSSEFTIYNSIIVGNTNDQGYSDIAPDAGIPLWQADFSGSNNLIGEAHDAVLTDGINPVDLELQPLGYYGGSTRTIALGENSPAIDAGDNSAIDSQSIDQRGLQRIANGIVDIGAIEFESSIVVDTTLDVVDSSDGVTSLREAIELAQLDPGENTITFDTTLFSTPQTIRVNQPLTIDDEEDEVSIIGPGADLLSISGGGISGTLFGTDSVFVIETDTSANLFGLTVTGGRDQGIENDGILQLDQVEVSENVGIGINSGDEGVLTIDRSTFAFNDGGGIRLAGTETFISNTTISGNEGFGGIEAISGAAVEITNATITNNDGDDSPFGGGINAQTSSEFTIYNSIIVGNTNDQGYSDIAPDAGIPLWQADFSGSNNLIGEAHDAVLTDGINPVDLELQPLGYYGGSTRTIALGENSPAIDAGDNSAIDSQSIDQRGLQRIANGIVDIGAIEFESSIVVDTTSDAVDLSDGVTSLREAIELAEQAPGAYTITFDESLFAGGAQTILLGDEDGNGLLDATEAPSQLSLNSDLTITGPGSDQLTITASHQSRIFSTTSWQRLDIEIEGVTLAEGLAGNGAAIQVYGNNLTLDDVIFRDNFAMTLDTGDTYIGKEGGAIFFQGIDDASYNRSQLTITNSTFDGNYGGRGGAIYSYASYGEIVIDTTTFANNYAFYKMDYVDGAPNIHTTDNVHHGHGGAIRLGAWNAHTDGNGDGTVAIRNSTIHNNTSEKDGAGISVSGRHLSVDIENSTLSSNHSKRYGGAIATHFTQDIDIVNSTITNNKATSQSGAIYNSSWSGQSNLALHNTIIAGNHRTNGTVDDLNGPLVVDSSHNLIGRWLADNESSLTGSNNTIDDNLDPGLLPLGDYGGPTLTHELIETSLAVDAGDTLLAPTLDQRGLLRNDFINGGGVVDIGAFEYYSSNQSQFAVQADNTLIISGTTGDDTLNVFTDAFGEVFVNGFSTGVTEDDIPGIRIYGDSGNDIITVSRLTTSIANQLTIYGEAGNDEIDVSGLTSGTPTYFEYIRLYGGLGNDTIVGSGFADQIFGGGGSDTLAGGSGSDTYYISNAETSSTVLIDDSGIDTLDFSDVINPIDDTGIQLDLSFLANPINSGVLQTLKPDLVNSPGIELVVNSSTLIENVIGTKFDDSVYGNDLNNTLSGYGGNDLLVGGLGDDVYKIDNNRETQVELQETGGNDTIDLSSWGPAILGSQIGASLDLSAPSGSSQDIQNTYDPAVSFAGPISIINDGLSSIENVIGTRFNDVLVGNSLNNHLVGGLGDDTYGFAGTSNQGTDIIVEHDGEGVDTYDFSALDIGTGINFDLSSTSSAQIVADNGSESLAINRSLGSHYIENIIGTDLDDTIIGDGYDNIINGFGGSDIISGGIGDDTYEVGAIDGTQTLVINDTSGVDTLDFSRVSNTYDDAGVTLDLLDINNPANPGLIVSAMSSASNSNGGIRHQIRLSTNNSAGIDNVTGTNYNDFITGDDLDNVFYGLGGNDTLLGGLGSDTLFGGLDSDTLFGGLDGDRLEGGSGDDSLFGEGGNDSIEGDSGLDIIYGNDGDDTIFGGDDADTIYGNEGNDYLVGDDDNDTLHGGSGEDTLLGEDGNDILNGDDDNDYLQGGDGNDELFGDDGDDTLLGQDGDDRLLGGDGVDTLNGEFGSDIYEIQNLSEDYQDDRLLDQESAPSITYQGTTNTAPVFTSLPRQRTLEVDKEEVISFVADPGEVGQNITYTVIGDPLPAGATFTNGTFTWTPTASDEGTSYTLAVEATDDGSPALSVSHNLQLSVSATELTPVEHFVSYPRASTNDNKAYQKFDWNLPNENASQNYHWVIEERLRDADESVPWREAYSGNIDNTRGAYSVVITIDQQELDYYGQGNFLGKLFDYRVKYTDTSSNKSSNYVYTTGQLTPGSADVIFGDRLLDVEEFGFTPVDQIVMDFFASPGSNPVAPDFYLIEELQGGVWSPIDMIDSTISSSYTETRSPSDYPDGWRVQAYSGGASYILDAFYEPHVSLTPTVSRAHFSRQATIPVYQGWLGSPSGFYIGSNNDFDSLKYDESLNNEGVINRPTSATGDPVVDSVPNENDAIVISKVDYYDDELFAIHGTTELYFSDEATFVYTSGINVIEEYVDTSNGTSLGEIVHSGDNITNPTGPFFVQGLVPSSTKGDQLLSYIQTSGTDVTQHEYYFTVVDIDLEIGGLDNLQEHQIGAFIQTNSDFSKGLEENGTPIPDNRRDPDTGEWVFDASNTEVMTPATLSWNAGVHEDLDIVLTYPSDVLVWSVDANGENGVLLESGVPYTTLQDGLDLRIEGLKRSNSFANSSITAKFIDPNNLLSVVDTDEVKYTVIDFYAVTDGDRDGVLSEASKGDRQLTWWYNHDSDEFVGPDEYTQESYFGENVDSHHSNGARFGIENTRDLEDLAPVNLHFDPYLVMLEGEGFTIEITADLTTNLDDDALNGESINLYRSDISTTDSKRHILDPLYAKVLVSSSSSSGVSLSGSIEKELQSITEGLNTFFLEAIHALENTKMTSETELVFSLNVKQGTTTLFNIPSRVRLHIKEIEDFFSTYEIDHMVGGADLRKDLSPGSLHHPDATEISPAATWDHAANPDFSYLSDGDNFVWVHGWNLRPVWKEAFTETTFKRMYWEGFKGKFYEFSWPTFYDEEGPEDAIFAGSASNLTYNPSEFQAYRSGQSLKNLLSSLQGNTHVFAHSMGNVVVAEALRQHAEVSSQSLVESYVSFASAMPSGAYGQTDITGTNSAHRASGTSFVRNTYDFDPTITIDQDSKYQSSDFDLLRYWGNYGSSAEVVGGAGSLENAYYMAGSKTASSKWINLYNPDDYATSFAWKLNNYIKHSVTLPSADREEPDFLGYIKSRLPSVGPQDFVHHPEIWERWYYSNGPFLTEQIKRVYSYDYTSKGNFSLTGYDRLDSGVYSNGVGSSPGANAYEVMAFTSIHNAGPVGTLRVRKDNTDGEWFDVQVDVGEILGPNLPNGYESRHNHSLHIRHTPDLLHDFWQEVIVQMGVSTSAAADN